MVSYLPIMSADDWSLEPTPSVQERNADAVELDHVWRNSPIGSTTTRAEPRRAAQVALHPAAMMRGESPASRPSAGVDARYSAVVDLVCARRLFPPVAPVVGRAGGWKRLPCPRVLPAICASLRDLARA